MIQPPYLQKGDTVALVCTARKFSLEEAQPAVALLESWGLRVIYGATIGEDNHQLGGTDAIRAADFNAMVANPTVKAIWCARGGYGSVRIIDQIDFEQLKRTPKWVIGFSDVTVFHSQIHQEGLQSLHGIMAFSVPKATEESKESLRKSLFGETISYEIASHSANRQGSASGVLVGGNLSILYSLLGSKSALDTAGKILFIEDLDEYLYHLDRMMYNLKRNGYFEELKGLIVGGMTDMHDNSIPFGQNAIEIIKAISVEYGFPIVFDFPAGHGEANWALRFGATVALEVKKSTATLKWI